MKVEHTNRFTLIDLSNAKHTWHAWHKTALFCDHIACIESEICAKRCAGDKGFKRHGNKICHKLSSNLGNNKYWPIKGSACGRIVN